MSTYFTLTDVKILDEYASYTKELPALLSTYQKLINLRWLGNRMLSTQFELNKLTRQVNAQAAMWRESPAIWTLLHSEIKHFTERLERQSESWILAPHLPDLPEFLAFITDSINRFLSELTVQQDRMFSLATGIYTTVPRLIDYMLHNLYTFSGWQNTLNDVGSGRNNPYVNSLNVIFIPADYSGARRTEALNVVEQHQQIYASSYAAASNIIGHFMRLREIATDCMRRTLELRDVKKPVQVESSIRILLISVKELHRMTGEASELFRQ